MVKNQWHYRNLLPNGCLVLKTRLGKSVNLNNFFTATVTAIYKDLPANSSFQADMVLNAENEKYRLSSTIANGRRYNPTNIFVRMKNGTDLNAFTHKLNSQLKVFSLDIDSIATQNLGDIYLSTLTMKSSHAKGNPRLLKIFLAIAGAYSPLVKHKLPQLCHFDAICQVKRNWYKQDQRGKLAPFN